jgi:hypothetical protein
MITHNDQIKEPVTSKAVSQSRYSLTDPNMRILDTLLSSVVTCMTSLPLILVLLTLQRSPAVPQNPPLDQKQISEVQQLLIDHDPRQLLASEFQEVRLSEQELNALITYIKNSNPVLKSVNIHNDLIQDGIVLGLSVPVELFGFTSYFNLILHLDLNDDSLAINQVDAGALTLPSRLLTPIGHYLKNRFAEDNNFQLLASFMSSLHFRFIEEERIAIILDWQESNLDQLGDQARQVFVSTREAERLQHYHETLVTTLAAVPTGVRRISLAELLRPLFLQASINSAGSSNPASENRAALIVLSAYLTEANLARLTGSEIELSTPRRLRVVIESREDLPRHVISSAAIAASAGASMAEVLSIYKEVHDARYRTGFSFTDIAANQAGALLGTLSSRSDRDALLFQAQMQNLDTEAAFLPLLGTYDGMTEEEFVEQYGSRDSDAYRQKITDITDSILAQPFYQPFAAL